MYRYIGQALVQLRLVVFVFVASLVLVSTTTAQGGGEAGSLPTIKAGESDAGGDLFRKLEAIEKVVTETKTSVDALKPIKLPKNELEKISKTLRLAEQIKGDFDKHLKVNPAEMEKIRDNITEINKALNPSLFESVLSQYAFNTFWYFFGIGGKGSGSTGALGFIIGGIGLLASIFKIFYWISKIRGSGARKSEVSSNFLNVGLDIPLIAFGLILSLNLFTALFSGATDTPPQAVEIHEEIGALSKQLLQIEKLPSQIQLLDQNLVELNKRIADVSKPARFDLGSLLTIAILILAIFVCTLLAHLFYDRLSRFRKMK